MKRRNLAIIIGIAAIAGFAGWRILQLQPPAPADEHGHGGHEEHGEHDEHGHGHEDEHRALGRVELTPENAERAGVMIEEAGPATVRMTLKLYGKVAPNEEHIAHVMPRYAGIVQSVSRRLGEPVKKDEVLAVVQSNESLQNYEVKSGISGTIISKDIAPGEFVDVSKMIFEIVDLSTVWVDFQVYRHDFPKLREGRKIIVNAGPGAEQIESTISYISPFGAENTQTMLARAVIPNPSGILRPGLFAAGEAVLDEEEVPVSIKAAALQTLENREVVFVVEGDSFEARPIETGKRDSDWVEVVSGLLPGERYAAANSFILKAELGKASAGHEH
jgi:cobalt-zinc-cadmium efflux system membrane fusion protein